MQQRAAQKTAGSPKCTFKPLNFPLYYFTILAAGIFHNDFLTLSTRADSHIFADKFAKQRRIFIWIL
jgi:hypothetical protein